MKGIWKNHIIKGEYTLHLPWTGFNVAILFVILFFILLAILDILKSSTTLIMQRKFAFNKTFHYSVT